MLIEDPVILFDNHDFLAADKPEGWLSVPSRQGVSDPRPCLGRWLEAKLGLRLWPVHRLDEDVSGLVLYAKGPAAHKAANAWFEGRTVGKTYEALTCGPAPAGAHPGQELIWESKLLRGKKRAYESPAGKPAKTRAIWEGPRGPLQAWSLEPLTGRPHQLRFDLARHGHPILGDTLYGAPPGIDLAAHGVRGDGIALRSRELRFGRCLDYTKFGLPEKLQASPLGGRIR